LSRITSPQSGHSFTGRIVLPFSSSFCLRFFVLS
jgi:hypothetical protein